MDHRCGARRPINATVFVRQRDWKGWRVAELADLSVSGALLRLTGPGLRLHARLRLELGIPAGNGHRLMHCGATVTRVQRNLAGVAFDELAPASLAPLFRGHPGDASRAARDAADTPVR